MPVARPKYERKICDAVTRVLEQRTCKTRASTRVPERDRVGPPVEYRFDLGNQHYALEHTMVEPFENEMQTGTHFVDFIRPIQDEIGQTLPRPGTYSAVFPLNPSAGMKPKERAQAQRLSIGWIRAKAQILYDRKPEMGVHDRYGEDFRIREKPPGLAFEIALSRSLFREIPPKGDGRLFISRFAPQNYEGLRKDRIKRALDDKCPKLDECKAEGATTVLILENRDISLTNHGLVANVIEELAASRDDLPDEIFYVDTLIEDRWTVWSLYRNGAIWPDEETPVRYHVFKPSLLSEV
jgi:hypothetical protein